MEASRFVGKSGRVYAMDKSQNLVEGLKEKAVSQGLGNLKAMISDITGLLPIEDNSIDVCLLSTVLHIFPLPKIEKTLFSEIRRILKHNGRVVIIECKKEAQPFGPPKHMRLSPHDIEESIQKYGFKRSGLSDLGNNYMIQFFIV
jgi:ubiquinone/menaquinone biosynthesis C-methylase UbiE